MRNKSKYNEDIIVSICLLLVDACFLCIFNEANKQNCHLIIQLQIDNGTYLPHLIWEDLTNAQRSVLQSSVMECISKAW